MSTTPHPPQPPTPPAPARPSSNIVAIVLLLLALIVVVSGLVVWGGLHYLARGVQLHVSDMKNGKQVSIQTPVGSFEVNQKEVNEAQLGLPVYPGATRVKDEDSAAISMDFGGEHGVHLMVAKFETTDDLDKVHRFYQDRVGSQAKITEKDSEGKTVFEIKHKGEERIIALKSSGAGTRIELVRVEHGAEQGN